MGLPYNKNETNQSFEYLEKVLSALDEPICIIGGWAIYLTVNKAYKNALNKDYLGSRDIDLGFHLIESKDYNKTPLIKAINKLKSKGFQAVSARLVKQLDFETGKELNKEEARKKSLHEINPMYIDLMADKVPKNFKEKTGFTVWEEKMIFLVFENKENRTELKEFGKKLWLPNPWVLLATKINSLPQRSKDHKRQKDICDIAALLLFKPKAYTDSNNLKKLLKAIKKKNITKTLKKITSNEITQTEQILSIEKNSFKGALTQFQKNIEKYNKTNQNTP